MLQQISSLQKEADELRRVERAQVIKSIRQQIRDFQLTSEDLGLAKVVKLKRSKPQNKRKEPVTKKPRKPAPVKYSNSKGDTWTGRGKMPKWLTAELDQGHQLDSFKLAHGS